MNRGHIQVTIRELRPDDVLRITATDGGAAWHGGSEKWNRYLLEHGEGSRLVLLADASAGIIGYGSLKPISQYPPFREAGIPEIQDLVVAAQYRRLGVGTRLIRSLEETAQSRGYSQVGIGFGVYRDYGAAQRLYVRMGYIPDGRGIFYRQHSVEPGTWARVDDYLVLWLLKTLAPA